MAPHIKTAGKIALGAACFPSAVIAGSALQLGSQLGRIVRATKDARATLKLAINLNKTKNTWNYYQHVRQLQVTQAAFNYHKSITLIGSGIRTTVKYGPRAMEITESIVNPGLYPRTVWGVWGSYIQKLYEEYGEGKL